MSNLELTYFKYAEFDSPDDPGSGKKKMDKDFLMLLDVARSKAGIPFKINSGYRTAAHSDVLRSKGYPVAKNSAHLYGMAADISCTNSTDRYKIIKALLSVGLNRIGVAGSFLHTDNMTEGKAKEVVWTY